MAFKAKTLFIALALAAVMLAGCTSDGPAKKGTIEEAPPVEATDTTGGIRGVVVDEAIRPIKDAMVEMMVDGTAKTVKTGESGTFALSGISPGVYFIKASHPLYNEVQQSVEVEAGVANPPTVKISLVRQIFQEPYLETLKFDGFIVCSANVPVGYSEECGEGVGTPCSAGGQTIPQPVGCTRYGRQGGNKVQFDFTIGDGLQSAILEAVWKPTSDAGKSFLIITASDWVCDPFCGGKRIVNPNLEGPSPLYGRFEGDAAVKAEVQPNVDPITMFTYASRATSPTPAPASTGLLLNQGYQLFVTNFYYVPAPEGWSLVKGSPNPFQ